jgi:hypothetical protein
LGADSKVTIDVFVMPKDFELVDLRDDGYGELESALESGNPSYTRGVPGARQESAVDASGALIDGNCITAAELARQAGQLKLDGWIDISCGGKLLEFLIVDPSRLTYKGCIPIDIGELLALTDAERGDLHLRIKP